MTQLSNLRIIAQAAVKCERETELPAELTAAQCILESGWLKNAPGNNPFGIKCAKRHQECQDLPTTEIISGQPVRMTLPFAKFKTLADAFADHGLLITTGKPYAGAWADYQSTRLLGTFIGAVAAIYATDRGYFKSLLAVIAMAPVQSAIAAERSPAQIPVDGTEVS